MPDKVRIGIVGCSSRGEIARHWHHPDGRSLVVGAADVSDGALDWFKKNVNADAFTTKDYRALLDRKDIDAIAVTSPDFTHEQYVCDAFAAGKHVFTDKPMAITTEGCDRMLRAWVASGKQFMVGHNMRYMNIFRVMKEAIDTGAIGEIKAVWVRHFVAHGGCWYFHDWHAASRNTTSLLLQKACHDIDMIHWLTGRYTTRVAASGGQSFYGGSRPNDLRCPACPDKTTCTEYQSIDKPSGDRMDQCCFRKEADVEDNSIVMMELDGGIHASYTQCHFTPEYWRNYTLIGTEGRIENLDDGSKVIVRMRDLSKREKNLANYDLAVKPAAGGHGGADPAICDDFVELLVSGKRPVATPLAGRMSVAAGCAATWSLRNGWQPVEIPPLPADIRERVY